MTDTHRLVLDEVRQRTQPGAGPTVTHFGLVGACGLAGLDTAVVPDLVADLRQRGHLLQYPPGRLDEDQDRTAVHLTLPEQDRLERWQQMAVSADDVDQDLVGWLNAQLQEVRD